MAVGQKMAGVMKGLICAYILTIAFLFITAVVVYKVGISDTVLNIIVAAIYILSTFVGGFITWRKVQERRFIWGMVFGILYISIALAIGAVMGDSGGGAVMPRVTRSVMCVAGGMLGAMLA